MVGCAVGAKWFYGGLISIQSHNTAPPSAGFFNQGEIVIQVYDSECYRNFWLAKFYNPETKCFTSFRKTDTDALDTQAIEAFMRHATIVTFNGNNYDMPMTVAALAGCSNESLKAMSDAIIQRNMRPWEFYREFNLTPPAWLDHIDLFEVAPGFPKPSLKIYGGRLHSKRMQDLPFDPAATLTRNEILRLELYCGNDLLTTDDLRVSLKDDLETRAELSQTYGVDMRSRSDAQIAEAAFKVLLPFKVYPPVISQGTQFHYRAPALIRFSDPELMRIQAMIEASPFTIGKGGSPEMTEELANCKIKIGTSVYRLGMGGLHSSEQSVSHVADENFSLEDVDVVSYYPKIQSIFKIYPEQIGPLYLTILDEWIDTRIAYKKSGNKKKAQTFKIKINGSFGKAGSMYSILYNPAGMIQTTLTGQLLLLMLISRLEVQGIAVVSANTDGVVIKCPRHLHGLRDAIVKQWEIDTDFETEANEYAALYSRDVNNYLALKPSGEFKAKGAYGIPGLAKNPTGTICITAVQQYILHGTPLERTIRGCSDIKQFVTIRSVRGGGQWQRGLQPDPKATLKAKRAMIESQGWLPNDHAGKNNFYRGDWNKGRWATLDEAYQTCFIKTESQYLGKAVRWYYARGEQGYIAYATNGNKVATSEGARPVMELPDVLPPDIDYDHYVNEAKNMLADINCC